MSKKELKIKNLPTIDFLLRTTWNAVVKAYNEEAVKYDFTMPLGFTLVSIDPSTGTSSTDLGPKMGMKSTSLSRTLKILEKNGYIKRYPNPHDGRGVIVKLTKKGLEYRKISQEVVITFNNSIVKELGEDKVRIFLEVSQGIQQMIEENKIYVD